MQFSHNFYINLDLADVVTKIRKLKAFVGYGNNCNMIKGLLKRRFWWTIAEDMAEDCAFVWTQIKIQGVYDRQPTAL